MSMDLTGITNKNEYYTNHYFSTVFEENAGETISAWNAASRESEEVRTPWSLLRRHAAQFLSPLTDEEKTTLCALLKKLTDAPRPTLPKDRDPAETKNPCSGAESSAAGHD